MDAWILHQEHGVASDSRLDLTVLGVLLKKAVKWDVIERVPCTIRLLPTSQPSAAFYDFDEYERLVAAAKTNLNEGHT